MRSSYRSAPDHDNTQTVFEAADYTDYYYTHLTETEKQAYTAVRKQVYDFPKSIKVPQINSDSLEKVLTALICDDPYLFMFDSCTLVTVGSSNYFEPDYFLTQQEYEDKKQQINSAVDSIFSALPNGSTYDKQLYLHDTLINSCQYSDSNATEEADISGVFIDGYAKCSGYAKAYKLLLDRAGIPCVLINGYAEDYDGNGTNHMWTATETDGVWSYTDITWDDPITENGEPICRRAYFCMSEDMLSDTHSRFEFDNDCPDTGLYYYKAYNLYYNDYNNETLSDISALISACANNGKTEVEFMFADSAAFDKAVKALFDSEQIYTALDKAKLNSRKSFKTDSIRYRTDRNLNTITLFLEIKD